VEIDVYNNQFVSLYVNDTLQFFCHSRAHCKSSITFSDNGLFKSTVTFSGKTAESIQGFPTKKEAEQSAAKAALISLGIEDPESFALNYKGRSVVRYLQMKPLLDTM